MRKLLRCQMGYGPVEILIAVTLSMIVMAGVYQTFRGSVTTYNYQEALARIQENGRFALEVINREMRMVGYTGCGNIPSPVNTLNNPGEYEYDFSKPISGFDANSDGTWTPVLDDSINEELPGSDVLVTRSIDPTGSVYVSEIMNNSTADMKTLPTTLFDVPDILMISDCESAAVFQVTNMTTTGGMSNVVHNTGVETPGNATKDLGHAFSQGAQISKITSKTFFVRNNPSDVPSLYMKEATSAAVELVEGVETLQVTYAESSVKMGPDTCEVSSYVPADAVTDWNAVCSMRVGMLLRSPEKVRRSDDTTTTYSVNGETLGPMNDRFLRRVFSQTIRLRNRPGFDI